MPQTGRVEAIRLRPAEGHFPVAVKEVQASQETGLSGDYFNQASSKRQVTLIQHEHLAVVAAILKCQPIDPSLTRRNLVVSGINILAFTGRRFQIGNVVMEGTGLCDPCEQMEKNLGPGGYNAMCGHGGLTARIIVPGSIREGDEVRLLADQ